MNYKKCYYIKVNFIVVRCSPCETHNTESIPLAGNEKIRKVFFLNQFKLWIVYFRASLNIGWGYTLIPVEEKMEEFINNFQQELWNCKESIQNKY